MVLDTLSFCKCLEKLAVSVKIDSELLNKLTKHEINMLACPRCSYLPLIFQLQNIMIWYGTFEANISYHIKTTGNNTAVRKGIWFIFSCCCHHFPVFPSESDVNTFLCLTFLAVNDPWWTAHGLEPVVMKRGNMTTCPAAWTRESYEEVLCREVPSMEFQ